MERKLVDQNLPQTLYMATMLLYFTAVFSVLSSGFNALALGFAALEALAAYGIANHYRAAYRLGVVLAALALIPWALTLMATGLGALFNFQVLIGLVFPVALFVLLVHPQSREHQKLFFEPLR